MSTLSADVYFGESSGSPAEGVQQVHLLEAEYEHERAIVHVETAARTSKRFSTGAPVSILWGRPPGRSRWFIGYVNHAEPTHSLALRGNPLQKVVCVGVTLPTKDQGYRTFRNLSPTSVIRSMAAELRLDLGHVDRYERNSAVLHQSGRSDWEFMIHCAKEAGFTLFPRGAALYCADRRVLVEQSASTSPILSPAEAGGSVRQFTPARGTNAPQGGDLAVRAGFSINPRSGAVLSPTVRDTGRPQFGATPVAPAKAKAQTGRVFSDLSDGYAQMGAEARVNSMGISATLVGAANPRCRVGKTVALTGFGPEGDGLWYVTAAEHVVGAAEQSGMTLALGRDTEMPAVGARTPPLSSKPPERGARLLSGRWVAA